MNLLVVVVDRLHIGYLGCYGNSWIGTPGVDHLAAQSVVFDRMLVDSPHLGALCETYWQGVHALARPAWLARHGEARPPSLPRLLRESGWQTVLVTDEPLVAHHPLAGGFEKRQLFSGRRTARGAGGPTALERLFAEAGRQLTERAAPFCLWVHSRAMADPWDAPLARRRQYAEEEDPFPADFRDVPWLAVDDDFDPDQLQGIRWAYAGQVTLLDDCLAALDVLLAESGRAGDTAVVLLGARGFPLGEHGHVGTPPLALYEELIHVPCLCRLPGENAAATRVAALAQVDDLAPTLAALVGLDPAPLAATGHELLSLVRGQVDAVRDRAAIGCWQELPVSEADDGEVAPPILGDLVERALRTDAWHLRVSAPSGDQPARGELYVKPDDRWEGNEISSRCEEAAVAMQATLDETERAARELALDTLAPLPDVC